MRGSISHKALAIALALVAPPVILLFAHVHDAGIRALALGLALAGMALAWWFAVSLALRINRMTLFVQRILNPGVGRPRLRTEGDELGELARALSRRAPEIEDLVKRLGTELTRREAILASMSEPVLAVDAHLNVTFCNPAFQQTVGDHGVVEGVPLIKMVRDPDLFRVLQRAVDSEETVRVRLRLAAGGGRSFDVYAAPLSGSAPRGAFAILHDVTPIERLERTKRDFIANVSHEFRTPLAIICGYAETLLESGLEDPENRRRFVEIIQANGVRLNNIAADLIALSELEAGSPAAAPGAVRVDEAISGALRVIEPAARLSGVRLHAGPVPEVEILGYGIRFEQALVNLLDNAVKFNKPDGEVRVEVRTRGDRHVEVTVADTGLGIPAEDLSRIFERFYRVDKTRSRQVGGTGLGLSIVKHAIEQMNGTVAAESQLGKGSRFTITLPQYART
ncbi:MAG: PAS domain-containing protein [Acidobacteriia bacterium]|nr:PAS domain-containing protein [Terriglobia bacterium]